MLDEWEMLYLGTGIVMCRRITTDRMSDSSGVHGGHGGLGTGEQVQVHANVQGGRRNFLCLPVLLPSLPHLDDDTIPRSTGTMVSDNPFLPALRVALSLVRSVISHRTDSQEVRKHRTSR